MKKQKEWRVENYIHRLLPKKGKLEDSFNATSRRQIKPEDITLDLLEECYVFAAEIVNQYGEHYLPIFERLHEEIANMRDKQTMLDLAKKLSKQNDNTF